MLTRTTSAKVVNGMLRAAFGDEAMDVSEHVKSRRNYAFVSDDVAVLFIRARSKKWAYSCILGVLPASQRKGIGTSTLREAIGWIFANTRAQMIRTVIDPKNEGANKLSSRIRVHANDRKVFAGRIQVSCTRESWAAMFPGGSDV